MTDNIFHENEVKTNRLVAKAVLAVALVIFAFGLLGAKGVLNVGPSWAVKSLLCSSVMILVCYISAKSIKFDKPFVKVILMLGLIILCGISYFLYTTTTSFILYGPILLSIKYYDKKFVVNVTLLSWLACVTGIAVNTVLYNTSEAFRDYKIYLSSVVWSSTRDVMLYIAIPRTLIFVLTGIIAYYIADDGRKMISDEVALLTYAIDNQKELVAAAEVQSNSLMPDKYESPNGEVNIRAYIKPAKEMGGDFYDYFMLSNDLRVALIADVSDKGLSAAVFGMQVKTVLRYTLMSSIGEGYIEGVESIDLSKTMSALNNIIVQKQANGLFVTMFIICMDVRTGVGKFINAGHAQPYIVHKDGSYNIIDTDPQLFLGAIPDTEYNASVLNLNSNDIILMYTDGVTDARNAADEMYGQERIEALLDNIGEPENSEEVTLALTADLDAYIGDTEQFDDITILSIQHCADTEADKISFDMPAEFEGITEAVTKINSFLSDNNCPDFIIDNSDVVIDEICSNIIEYGYKGENGIINIECRINRNAVMLIFKDTSAAFDITKVEAKVIPDEPEIGGLGIHLVKSLVDDIKYEYKDGTNILTTIKVWNI